MDITELEVTGYDGAAILFTARLTPDSAALIRPGTDAEGAPVTGEARQKATEVFATIRDLINDIVNTSDPATPPHPPGLTPAKAGTA
jgi:hypothetical protein